MSTFSCRLALLLTLVACNSTRPGPAPEPATPTEPTPTTAPAPAPPPPADVDLASLPEVEIRGCTTDADCVISCRNVDQCCPQLCDCTNVYNRAFLARLEAQQASCAEPCPVARCMPPEPKQAACRDAVCQLVVTSP